MVSLTVPYIYNEYIYIYNTQCIYKRPLGPHKERMRSSATALPCTRFACPAPRTNKRE